MIDFTRLEREKDVLREQFLSAKPFLHIAIDDFLLEGAAEKLYEEAPILLSIITNTNSGAKIIW